MKIQTKRILMAFFLMIVFLLLPALTHDSEESQLTNIKGVVTIQLVRTSDYSRIDFDTAFTMVWSGDIIYQDDVIGEFNAQWTKTTLTGIQGSAVQWDLVVFGAEPIGDWVSIRTNHIVAGAGYDEGMIFAASPAFGYLVGATVIKDGIDTTISW